MTRTRRRSPLLAGLAALIVAASLAGPAAVPRAAMATGTAKAPEPDRVAAARTAKARGTRVEVDSEKTDSSSLWANPDGTFTLETFPGPVRVKDGGTWRPIDTSLVRDGRTGLRPKLTTSRLRMSDGGGEPFAEVGRADRSFAVSWDRALPAPRIKGDTATYQDVVPGGDLTVKALPNGFSHAIVLREPPTRPLEITLPVATKGLRLSGAAGDGLDLHDSSGALLASAPAPRMWDSTTDPRSGEPVHQAAIDTTIKRTGRGAVLVLKPDAEFLADPAVRYPVTVDPTSTLTVETDTWVQSDIPDSQRGSTELKAGTYDGSHVARSYLKFRHIEDLRGTRIVDSDLRLWTFWSSVCVDPSAGVQARRITSDWDPDTVRYGSEPATTTAGAVTTKTAHGAANCPQDFMHWDTDAIVKAWADGQPDYGIQLRGADEKDASTWRRYYSSNYVSGSQGDKEPALSVTFTYKVGTPGALSAAPAASDNSSSRTVVSTTPSLSAKVADAGSPLNYAFEVARDGGDVVAGGTVGDVAPGAAATWQVPAGKLLNARTYAFRVKAAGTAGASAWSSWYRFTTDAANTPTGLVTSLQEPANPVLSGLVTRAGAGMATGRFYLFDAAGQPVGKSPLGAGTEPAGQRIALRVPDGLVEPGKTYKWQMDGCADGVCSARSPLITFTAPRPSAPPATSAATIGRDKIVTTGAMVGTTACDGGECALTPGTTDLALGGSGDQEKVARVKLDLGAVPAGAVITSAVLSLGAPTCPATCPAGAKVAAYEFESGLPDRPTGADVAGNLLAEPFAEVAAASPAIDVTGLVQGRGSSDDQGFLLRLTGDASAEARYGSADSGASIKVEVGYVPAAAPSEVGSVTIRPGDGGVLAVWAPPATVGADAPIDQYDVQVLDGSERVVSTVTAQGTSAVVKGLTDGTAYHVRVRAKTAFGTGPWRSSSAATPVAVPGGAQKYLDAIRQYHQNRQALVEGRYGDVDAALAATSRSDLYASALRVSGEGLYEYGQAMRARGYPQKSSTVTLSDTLATYSPDGNTLTVRATVDTVATSEATDPQPGDQAPEPSEEQETTDYSFRVNSLAVDATSRTEPSEDDGLARVAEAADVDLAAGAPVAANAVPTGEEPEADDMPVIPRDDNGLPTETPDPATPAAAAPRVAASDVSAQRRKAYNETAAARWAVSHFTIPHDYEGHDCENFLSKVMYHGGGLTYIRGFSHGSWYDKRNWYRLQTCCYMNNGSTLSWRLVDALYWNLKTHRKRLGAWRRHDWDVRVGDLIFWRYKNQTGYYHITIVTQIVGQGSKMDIRYTGHTSDRKNYSVYNALAQNRNIVAGFIPVAD
ncbi:DNRLRE domain-containing protein [Nonomuraea sp. SMC257]|uniref:DNRLRE domain-containing protein n=1 Tax=Nonomuraea montanisoli TaxID=2741721 RepID=A0A7Y6IEG3_9ACTN|nr:DNRLRE domain-containing protein [Nonomuraea montanisoli]NUW36777.1 DNRLRE domain-containing protein [Nonomuraea montanisoli]